MARRRAAASPKAAAVLPVVPAPAPAEEEAEEEEAEEAEEEADEAQEEAEEAEEEADEAQEEADEAQEEADEAQEEAPATPATTATTPQATPSPGQSPGRRSVTYTQGDFRTWLVAHRCGEGVPPTHTSIDKPKGRFHVAPEDEADFYRLYLAAIRAGEDVHLTERPMAWSPVRFDLDLRFAAPPPSHPGNTHDDRPPQRVYVRDDHIRRIVLTVTRLLRAFLDVPPAALRTFVMEKPAPIEVRGGIIKDGVHLQLPDVVTETPFQFFLREKLLTAIPDILGGLGVTNPWTDVVDDKIIELNNWQLYGSRKPGYSAYAVTAVYEFDPAAGPDGDVVERAPPALTPDVLRFLSVRGRGPGDGARFAGGASGAEVSEWIRCIYPSVAGRKRDALNQQVFAPTVNRFRNMVSLEELTTVRKLTLECLGVERAETYDTWVRVGWALRNIDHRLLDTWIEFSKLSSKYVGGECEKKWSKMRMDGTLGIGSIRYWARQDNMVAYKRIMDDSLQILIDRCALSRGTAHFDIALVVQNVFKDQFVFVGKNRWFFYDAPNHRWSVNCEGQMIRLRISVDIASKFTERANALMTRNSTAASSAASTAAEAGVASDGRVMAPDDAMIKVLHDIATKLRQSPFKTSVLKECETLMNEEKFEDKLDSKPHLIGFRNGVYDLALREFRDGQPDDYISFSTNLNYVPFDPNSCVVTEIRHFFRTVHRNPAVERYMWDILASALDGGAKSEKFYIMTGNGSNGARSKNWIRALLGYHTRKRARV